MPTEADRLERIERRLRQLVRLVRQSAATDRRWLRVPEAASYAALSEESVRRLLAAGRLTPHYPTRGRVLVDRREVDALIGGATRRPVGGRGKYDRNGLIE